MPHPTLVSALAHCFRTAIRAFLDLASLPVLAARSHSALVAENLFLRKQLALFQERKARPRRAHDSTRWVMATLSRLFPWRDALVNVKPETLIRWHRKGFRRFWREQSKPVGRPPLSKELRRLIRQMAAENVTWGEEPIANELHWLTFVHNHCRVIVASDFFVVITATFRSLYVFVVMEISSRRLLHHNVTAHPTAEWTLQQFREALPDGHPYRFVIHDRDTIYSKEVEEGLANLGVRVLRTPVRAPKANAVCERLGGSLRWECLDFVIPFNERHLKMTVQEWASHYNRRRPHSSLGPGFPEPAKQRVPETGYRHRLPEGFRVVKTSVLGGLHHEYSLLKEAA